MIMKSFTATIAAVAVILIAICYHSNAQTFSPNTYNSCMYCSQGTLFMKAVASNGTCIDTLTPTVNATSCTGIVIRTFGIWEFKDCFMYLKMSCASSSATAPTLVESDTIDTGATKCYTFTAPSDVCKRSVDVSFVVAISSIIGVLIMVVCLSICLTWCLYTYIKNRNKQGDVESATKPMMQDASNNAGHH